MFREEVADHYRNKGYKLHERVKIRGESGSIHAVDMVAQSQLGNLIITFEDEGDFEGPEMGAMRRAARDVGATAVVAVENMPDGLRQHAARAGVVLLDRESMKAPRPEIKFDPAPPEPEQVPWPTQEKSRRDDPGIWRYDRARAPEPVAEDEPEHVETELSEPAPRPARSTGFDWLPPAPKRVESKPVPEIRRAEPEAKREVLLGIRVVLLVLAGGAAAGAAFFGLSFLL